MEREEHRWRKWRRRRRKRRDWGSGIEGELEEGGKLKARRRES